ncbi:hypothetical protein ACHAQH_007889 [Verticillium albo-atrum]
MSGFNPVPSCMFAPEFNNTFFCATSSFLAFPGLPIHASHDLVHWKHVSNGFSRPDQLPGMAFLPKATSGIYAPTLRFHQGIFYLMSTLVNQQLPRVNDSGLVLGVYALSNGKHGEQAFETYILNWRYQGIRQLRSDTDAD